MIARRGTAPTPLADLLRREPAISEALLYAAMRHVTVRADAEDLLQETLRAGLARSDPPDVADRTAVQRFFGSILNGLGANFRRAARQRTTVPYDDEVPPSSSRAWPNPERARLEREEELARHQRKADLRALLADEPRVLELWDLAEEGVHGRAALAQRMGCTPDDVTKLQRRLTYHARRLRARADEEARRAS